MSYTPFRIEDAQSNGSNPVISAPERGRLNEKWCKTKKRNNKKGGNSFTNFFTPFLI